MDRLESNIRNFYKRFHMAVHIEEKHRRQPISPEKQKDVVNYFEKHPRSALRNATSSFNIGISKMREILNENQNYYIKTIPMPSLTDQHKENSPFFKLHLQFFSKFTSKANHNR